MFRKHDEAGHGGDRPWVYFMIDCFFLVTQFFVLTFHVRSDEMLLPQKLPPGGTHPGPPLADTKRKITVHVNHSMTASYDCMQKAVDITGLTKILRNAGPDTQVKVSYEKDVPFADVMAVFNACNKLKISECGLTPLHLAD